MTVVEIVVDMCTCKGVLLGLRSGLWVLVVRCRVYVGFLCSSCRDRRGVGSCRAGWRGHFPHNGSSMFSEMPFHQIFIEMNTNFKVVYISLNVMMFIGLYLSNYYIFYLFSRTVVFYRKHRRMTSRATK